MTETGQASARRIFWIKTLTLVGLVATWELLGRSGLFYPGVMPSSATIAEAVWFEIIDSSFYHDLGVTALETVVGFIGGATIAVAVGICLGLSNYARKMIEPYIIALGGTPKIIFLPILFLIFGLGLESKMAKGALSTFFPVVLSTLSGFIQIPPVLLRVGESFGLSRGQKVWKIYLPAMSNELITGLRLGIAMALIGVLSAEITYANAGLGYRLIRDSDQFRIPSVYAITLLIFAMSSTINLAMTKLQERINRHERGRRGKVVEFAPVETAVAK